MARSRRPALALALLLVTAGCGGAGVGGPDVTPAPVPVGDGPISPTQRSVVDVQNARGDPHAVAVTLVEGDVPWLEVTWTNGTSTAVGTDPAGRASLRRLAAAGAVRDLGLPDDIKSNFAAATAEPGGNASVGLRSAGGNPTVVIEVRPVAAVDRPLVEREPLVLAVVVDCRRGERFESFHVTLGDDVEAGGSMPCVPLG